MDYYYIVAELAPIVSAIVSLSVMATDYIADNTIFGKMP